MSIGKICAIHPDLFRQSIHFPKVASHRTVLTLAYHKREFLLMIQLLLGYSLVTCLYQTSSNRRYHQGCVVPTGQHHPVVQIQQTIDSILPQTCSCACSSTNFLSNPAFQFARIYLQLLHQRKYRNEVHYFGEASYLTLFEIAFAIQTSVLFHLKYHPTLGTDVGHPQQSFGPWAVATKKDLCLAACVRFGRFI